MELTLEDDVVRADRRARERFYDSRGYGHVTNGSLALAPVEAAHLLARGDIDAVDEMGLRELLASRTVSAIEFVVYKDLRDRGFYLTPAREGWVEDPDRIDFVVYPRGKGPWDDAVAYRVRVVGERDELSASSLGDCVLAVVDEESEITYLDTTERTVEGTSHDDVSPLSGELLSERVLCWEPPTELYERTFYGQQLGERAVQLSLVEAAHLARAGTLAVEGGSETIVDRGRAVEGERFDRRLAVYTTLRSSGVVPKTGFKFGADFRTYTDVSSVEDLGHSELLVRVVPADHEFELRDLALDVRLAHGVRKTMVFGLVDGDSVGWLEVTRLTP